MVCVRLFFQVLSTLTWAKAAMHLIHCITNTVCLVSCCVTSEWGGLWCMTWSIEDNNMVNIIALVSKKKKSHVMSLPPFWKAEHFPTWSARWALCLFSGRPPAAVCSLLSGNDWKTMLALRKRRYVDTGLKHESARFTLTCGVHATPVHAVIKAKGVQTKNWDSLTFVDIF